MGGEWCVYRVREMQEGKRYSEVQLLVSQNSLRGWLGYR